MSFGPNDVVFVLGAGASIPAEILAANGMILELEKAFDESHKKEAIYKKFNKYKDLYFQIKSSILYAQGLRGVFEKNIAHEYHIETLVRATFEIERYLDHPLYPFIANWNQRFFDQAGRDFCNVKEFSGHLREQLRSWIIPSNYKASAEKYYRGFRIISRDVIQFPLRVFSLNYDLCLESIESEDFVIEQGFDGDGFWNWRRMQSDIVQRENQEMGRCNAFLYKMHGSIDWTREDDGRLKRVARPEELDCNQIEIIFGREDKMTVASSDPFLYYISQFRAALHSAKLVVCIGYSFSDDHINRAIGAALNDRETRGRCLSVTYARTGADEKSHKLHIARKLSVPEDRIDVFGKGADKFLISDDIGSFLDKSMPIEESPPF